MRRIASSAKLRNRASALTFLRAPDRSHPYRASGLVLWAVSGRFTFTNARSEYCGPGTRNLLELFQIAIDPVVSKVAIIYTDDTLTTSNASGNFACLPNQAPPCPLPQAVLGQQN
jgi:hypothetical protein